MLAHLWVYSRMMYDSDKNTGLGHLAWDRKKGMKYKNSNGLIDGNKYWPVVKYLFGTSVEAKRLDGTLIKREGKQVYRLEIDNNKNRYGKVMRFLAESNDDFTRSLADADYEFPTIDDNNSKVGPSFDDAMAAFELMTPSDMLAADTANHKTIDYSQHDDKVSSVKKVYSKANLGSIDVSADIEHIADGFGIFVCEVSDNKITIYESISLADDDENHAFKVKAFVRNLYDEEEDDGTAAGEKARQKLIHQARLAA